jgi:nucleoside-diphosphate-sugar epimerase
MKRIIVTGGSGKAGRAVVRDLLAHEYVVLNVDLMRAEEPLAPYLKVDLTDLGQTFEALRGADAVVHLAAIPAPGLETAEVTFRTNITSTYNVFQAATALGLERVVWASSETTLGLPFDRVRPAYAPIDEDHPLYPETSYALSKVLSEEMARQFTRWSDIPFVGLRFSNVMEPDDYQRFPTYWTDPRQR